MKKLFASLAVVLIVAQAKAANVHILDAGINPSHYSYIQDRIIAEGCYSYSGTDDLSFTDRSTGVTVY